MQVFTKAFSQAFTINSVDGVYFAAFKARNGTVTALGVAQFQDFYSDEITLQDGESLMIPAQVSNPIEGLTLTPAVNAFCDTLLIK